MIEFMMANSSFGDFYEIKNISEMMKSRMIEHIEVCHTIHCRNNFKKYIFQNSEWLKSDEISSIIREKLIERVASVQVFHDFDEIDKNGTMIRQLQLDFSELYITERR